MQAREASPKRQHQRERSRSPRHRDRRLPLVPSEMPAEIVKPKYQSTSPGYSPQSAAFIIHHSSNDTAAISAALEREQLEKKEQLKQQNKAELEQIQQLRSKRDRLKNELENAQTKNQIIKTFNEDLKPAISQYEKTLQIPVTVFNNSANEDADAPQFLPKKIADKKKSHSSIKKEELSIQQKIDRLNELCEANNKKITELKKEIRSLKQALKSEATKNDNLIEEQQILKKRFEVLKNQYRSIEAELLRQAQETSIAQQQAHLYAQAQAKAEADAKALAQALALARMAEAQAARTICVSAMSQALQNFHQGQMQQNPFQQPSMQPMGSSCPLFWSQGSQQTSIPNPQQAPQQFFSSRL